MLQSKFNWQKIKKYSNTGGLCKSRPSKEPARSIKGDSNLGRNYATVITDRAHNQQHTEHCGYEHHRGRGGKYIYTLSYKTLSVILW